MKNQLILVCLFMAVISCKKDTSQKQVTKPAFNISFPESFKIKSISIPHKGKHNWMFSKKDSLDGLTKLERDIDSPQIVSIYDENYTNYKIFVEPNSKQVIVAKNSSFFISGKDSIAQSFLNSCSPITYKGIMQNPDYYSYKNNTANDALKGYKKYINKYQLKLDSLSNKKLISTSFKKQLDNDLFAAEVFSKANIYTGLFWRTTLPEQNESYLNKLPDSTFNNWSTFYKNYPIEDSELIKKMFWFYYAENYIFVFNGKAKDKKEFDYDAPSYHIDKINYAKTIIKDPKTLEYFITCYLFDKCQQNRFEKSLISIYNDIQKQFPNSDYLQFITPEINKIKEYHKKIEADYNEETVFINEYENVDSLEELISQFKGKNIYIDVWATWCGPCKDEFKHNRELNHFLKENDIEMIYISFDKERGHKKWLEMIKYYDLKGDHIRNNDQLYDNLIVEYQNNGSIAIPWYMIVNKEGKIVERHAKRPSDKEELYKQLQETLNL
ncbi:MAG: TlpA family protein disulfide reductase [Flavobacteriaceae bacterium]|nr:TlpA family protein disulfide reductase [Flavobacteriaceae bacterium]